MEKVQVLEIMSKGTLLDDYEVHQYSLFVYEEKSTFIIYDDVRNKWYLARWNDYQDYFYFKKRISEQEAIKYITDLEQQPTKEEIEIAFKEIDKAISQLQSIFEDCGDSNVDFAMDLLVKPFELIVKLKGCE